MANKIVISIVMAFTFVAIFAADIPKESTEVHQARLKQRLLILQDEKNSNLALLEKAKDKIKANPTDKNADDGIKLAQANIKALDVEISNTQGKIQNPEYRNTATTNKVVAAEPAPAKASEKPTEKGSSDYAAWDVFKNFPQQ